jgi:Phasin protein
MFNGENWCDFGRRFATERGAKNLLHETVEYDEFWRENPRSDSIRQIRGGCGTQGADDMTRGQGPFDTRAGENAEHSAKHFQQATTHYLGWLQNRVSAAPQRVTEHMNDAVTLVQKVTQARDLHDVVRVHAEFVQKKIDMFNGRAKELNEVMTTVSHALGAFVSVLQLRKVLDDTARNSPKYTASSEHGRRRTWSAKR